MKKILLSFTSLALMAGAAFAADLPSRKAEPLLPPPPPPSMWTGFYVGLNAGGTWANSNQQTIGVGPVSVGNGGFWTPNNFNDVATFSAAASASGSNSGANGGFIGGGQIGYNWQFYNSFVAGLEADIQGLTGNSGGRSFVNVVPTVYGDSWVGMQSARGSLDYIGTVHGRLGWLFMPTLLVYGAGGLAYGGVTLNTTTSVSNNVYSPNTIAPAFGGVNFSNTQVGWTAGGGIEWTFMPNWSAKVEYLYYDLGTVKQNFTLASSVNGVVGGSTVVNDTSLFGGQVRARINGNIVRAGVNYHFNLGAAPVVAKY